MKHHHLTLTTFDVPDALGAHLAAAGGSVRPLRDVTSVHDVLVTFDAGEPPATAWLAICLCEQGTTPQATLDAAVRDGCRHLREHGVMYPEVVVAEP